MFKNLIFYRAQPITFGLSAACDHLDVAAFVPCGPSQEKSTGFVPPREANGSMVEAIDGQWIMKLMTEAKSVPADVVNRKAAERCAQIEASTGRKPGKKEIRDLKDDIRLDLLPMAFAKQAATLIWLDTKTNLLAIGASSQARADKVVTLLVQALPGFAVTLVNTQTSPVAAMLEQAFRAVTSQREGWADNVLPNVWLIATISTQAEADRDITKLLATPAAKRGLSMEPLLGPVNLRHLNEDRETNEIDCLKPDTWDEEIERWRDTEDGWEESFEDHYNVNPIGLSGPMYAGIDWVIVGGESGPNARPMHPDWVRSLRDQCQVAGVPFFFKQWGEWICAGELRRLPGGGMPGFGSFDGCRHDMASDTVRVGKKAAGRQIDGREWNGVPA